MSKSETIISTLFGGQLLQREGFNHWWRFILYIFLLVILYIGLHNTVNKALIENYRLEKELKTLHAEYISKSAELMRLSRRQEVEKELEAKGSLLHAPINPPQWVEFKKE